MLTLRYDPTIEIKSPVPKIVPNQVKIMRSGAYAFSKELQKEVRTVVTKKMSELDPKGISLALSKGVDSNLMLPLIRDDYPELAQISLVFLLVLTKQGKLRRSRK